MKEYVIEARDLKKSYGDVCALQGIDITVGRGEIYGLIGDNGAGKTTFLKLLTGQVWPDGGELRMFGAFQPKDLERQRKRTGAIVEAAGFYPRLTVEQNLEYYRIQRGIPGKGRVKEVLKTVGLLDQKRSRGGNLSMGMKQRLGLAIALLGEPELLILDEPINGLDPSGIIEMRNLLLKLSREKNITIILSSHILSELEQTANVFGFLSRGYLLEQVSASELKERCSAYISIAVSEPGKYTVFLEKELKETGYQVMLDGAVRICCPSWDIQEYSALASRHGIDVYGLEKKQEALEDYYMNLKNRGKLAC